MVPLNLHDLHRPISHPALHNQRRLRIRRGILGKEDRRDRAEENAFKLAVLRALPTAGVLVRTSWYVAFPLFSPTPGHQVNSHCRIKGLTPSGRANPTQIGLARLITDHVSFAYITDVYVLPAHQGKGLGTWLMQCVTEELSSWPELRRSLLMSNSEGAGFYRKVMGHVPFEQGEKGFELLGRRWGGSGIDA